MENKFAKQTEEQINSILKEIDLWKDFFLIEIKFYFDGWAIFLKEKYIYPRNIVLFKSYEKDCYSIKSFEVQMTQLYNEKYKEIYSVEDIKTQEELFKELKDIIFGKYILKDISKNYKNSVLNK